MASGQQDIERKKQPAIVTDNEELHYKSKEGGKRDKIPLPFVRRLRYHLDSCSGTNKSQFVFGGLGMLLATGILDAAHVLFMVVGHTKFGPDIVARAIAGRYNVQDTFNHGQLNSNISNYSTVIGYDDNFLQTWRRATKTIFKPIEHIMQYRSFFLLADDGGVTLKEASVTGEDKSYPTKGRYYRLVDLQTESEKLAARSIVKLIPRVIDGSYRGIGEASIVEKGLSGEVPADVRLLPKSVTEARRVRIFLQHAETDELCVEQDPWTVNSTVEMVNKVLRIISSYHDVGQMEKTPYGAKKKQIYEQFVKFVPDQFIPDEIDICTEKFDDSKRNSIVQSVLEPLKGAGSSGRDNGGSFDQTEAAQNTNGADKGLCSDTGDVATLLKNPRWNKKVCSPILLSIIKEQFGGKVPSSSFDLQRLMSLIPHDEGTKAWCPGTLKRNANQLRKDGLL